MAGSSAGSMVDLVYRRILADIRGGRWSPGQRLPAEPAMARELGVSRETWRQVLVLLRQDGLVRTRPNAGTEVVVPTYDRSQDLALLASSAKLDQACQIKIDRIHQESGEAVPPDPVLAFFEQPVGAVFYWVRRVFYSKDQAVRGQLAWLPSPYAGSLIGREPKASLRQYFAEVFGIRVTHAVTELVIPDPTTDRLCQAMKLGREDRVLGLRQGFLDDRELPVYWADDHYREGWYRFYVERRLSRSMSLDEEDPGQRPIE